MAFSLPVDLRDVLHTGARVREEREQPVRIAVLVDVQAPEALVDAFEEALRPASSQARIHVELVRGGEIMRPDDMADAVIALAGPNAVLAESLEAARASLVPTLAVALDADRDAVARRLRHPELDTVVDIHPHDAVHRAGGWLVDRVESKKLALAANFAFMRRAVAEEAVKATSMQNGVIGGVVFIPGADMPLMTANQVKMIMQIAAAYAEPLGAERVKELAAVIGGGFALRAVARSLLGFIPGFGWAVKAGIGYSGTWAMGRAAIEYFESGGSVAGVISHVAEARRRAVEGDRETIEADAVVVDIAARRLPTGTGDGGL